MEATQTLDPAVEHDGYLTIEQLAEQVGMSVRNLREWKTLGLLPAAELRGRVGYYPPAVLERIARIGRLRAEGFKLELISRMLDTGEAADEVIRLAATLRAPLAAPPDRVGARMAEIGAELAALGMSEEQILAGFELVRGHADGIAAYFEGVWREQIWDEFAAAGSPPERLGEIVELASRVRPLALDAVVAVFTQAMEAQIESGIARELGG